MIDEDYLEFIPFLSNSGELVRRIDINIEKIERTNVFDDILENIYDELKTLITTNELKTLMTLNSHYEVTKFYLTILLLKGIDNVAVKRIWIKYFLKKIKRNMKDLLDNCRSEQDRINTFLDIFRLLETNQHYKLKRITIDGEVAFGMYMMTYLDVFESLFNDTTVLHRGYVIIPCNAIEFLITFIQKFAEKKINTLYERSNFDVTITKKMNLIVSKIREEILESQKVFINVKKHFGINKELLLEKERIKDVENANNIINQLEDLSKEGKIEGIDIQAFPPCVNVILNKLLIKKEKLSHNENILLCTYLEKKHFDIEQVKKIFSKAVNYDPKTTRYQVEFLYKKGIMPQSCVNLNSEGLCYKDKDQTNQCGHIKNPLVFK